MKRLPEFALAAGLILAVLAAVPAAAGPAYFQYPDVHGNQIVFMAESDLWLVPDTGGAAHRITIHPGTEFYPRFSPDGKWIAFSGQYDGNTDVYVIPAEGGEPKRLTWHPGSDNVVGWTPDGTRVLFQSARFEPNRGTDLFSVALTGGDPEQLPIGYAARIGIDSASGLWAFTRLSGDRTWKRYRGGSAPDIWVGDPKTGDYKKVTSFEGLDDFPMWNAGLVYYLCDRGGTTNIWSMKPDGSEQKRRTSFTDWDARQASMGADGRIAFTLGADVYLFNCADDKVQKVEIDVPSDRILTRERYTDAADYITGFDVTPDAGRLAIVTRGEIFSVPVKKGVTLDITHGTGARENFAAFDPEGKQLAYVCDEPREEEICVVDAWGREKPRVVRPAGESGFLYSPLFSPDGKWVAYGDQSQSVTIVPALGGTPKKVEQAQSAEIHDYVWSPDSRWLAYSSRRSTGYGSIKIYDVQTGEVHPVTGMTTDDYSPSWDPEGRYLYFASNRATNPILGNLDWDNVEAKRSKLFAVLLRKDVKNPFAELEGLPPAGDEKKDADKKDKKDEKKDKGDENKPAEPVKIDFDGIADRVVAFPRVEHGNYAHIEATGQKVFFLSIPVKGFAEQPGMFDEPGPDNTLMVFDLEKKEPKPFAEGISDYRLARKAEKIAYMKDKGEFFVVEANQPPEGGPGGGGPDLSDARVSMKDVVVDLDPREEWAQMYYQAWRDERDRYWDAGMAGLDWKGIRDHYATLLPRLSVRSDLGDLIGEMIGELNTSHTYVWGGDPGVKVDRVSVGLLGADVKRDGAAYKIVRIYRGDPADNVVSPLMAPGVNLSEGDEILEVDHVPFAPDRPFYSYFKDLANRSVVLTVNSSASRTGAHDVVVVPVGNEHALRYADWVRKNREYVAAKTGGKIGYVHIPDMWADGLIRFNTWFYPQLDKEGMIVDGRFNGGGAVSQMIVERLRRHLVSFDRGRWSGLATYPDKVLNGPFVVVTNEFAGSDGDIFPAVVQLEKLAPVIGMRTWGGVIGISESRMLVDGGTVTQPQYAWWDTRGWSIENHGIDPDIVIDNLPQDLAHGQDPQLDRAIQEVMKLHDANPPEKPNFGAPRTRTRNAFGNEMTGF